MIPDSTNVRVIADNIRSLKNQTSAIPSDKIPKDYSENETDTGVKWIDGKSVYSKVLSGTLPEVTASGAFTIAENMDINLLSVSGVVLLDGFQMVIPYFNGTTYCGLRIRNTDKVLQAYLSSSSFSQRPYRFILLYTKPNPVLGNRGPDEVPDDEPETKKLTKRKTTKGEN